MPQIIPIKELKNTAEISKLVHARQALDNLKEKYEL